MIENDKPTEIKSFPGAMVEHHLRTHGSLPNDTCYTKMTSTQLISACGDDADKWATALNQHLRKMGKPTVEQDFLRGWFANAIEHSADVKRWRKDGLPFAVDPDHMS